jgi:hypothetical protein
MSCCVKGLKNAGLQGDLTFKLPVRKVLRRILPCGANNMKFLDSQQKFHRNILPPSSGLKKKERNQYDTGNKLPTSKWILGVEITNI